MLNSALLSLSRPRLYHIVFIALLVAGFLLRLAPIDANRFHEDEALYSYWGLQIATGADPMLDRLPIDKPPLFLYLLALLFKIAGPSEIIARLPALTASTAALALAGLIATRVYGRRVGLLALALLALNPFDISFAVTAFTDPLLVALALGSLLAAVARRPGLAGVLLGLAFATKQQALLFAPLIAGAGYIFAALSPRSPLASLGEGESEVLVPRPSPRLGGGVGGGGRAARLRAFFGRLWARPAARGVAGALLAGASAFIWDAFRLQRPGFFVQSFLSYGGLSVAAPGTWIERAGDWLGILERLAGGPALAVAGAGAVALLLAVDVRMLRGSPHPRPLSQRVGEGSRRADPASLSRAYPLPPRPSLPRQSGRGRGILAVRLSDSRRPYFLPRAHPHPPAPSPARPSADLGGQARGSRTEASAPLPHSLGEGPGERGLAAAFDLLLAGFCLAFLLLHWLVAFNVWDRYLLALAPLGAILAARAVLCLGRLAWSAGASVRRAALRAAGRAVPARPPGVRLACEPALAGVAAVAILAALAGPAGLAAAGAYPAGGDHGAYAGIDDVAAYVSAHAPAGSYVHQRWLGWHLNYYMYGFPLSFHWYASPAELAQQACREPAADRWVIAPAWRSFAGEQAELALEGLAVEEVYRSMRPDGSVSFHIYGIVPAPRQAQICAGLGAGR